MLSQTAGRRMTPHACYKPVWLPYEVDGSETLAEATAEDRHIRTICKCGQISEFDGDEAWFEVEEIRGKPWSYWRAIQPVECE